MDNLYFGSCEVSLFPVAGEVIPFCATEWSEGSDASDIARVCQRFQRQTTTDSVPDVVVPAIPALDFVSRQAASNNSERNQVVPEFLQKPLLKLSGEQNGLALKGRASGARSALVQDETSGVWYRLKGCGNHNEGFTVRVNKSKTAEDGLWRDIRGCAFMDTAIRELKMADTLESITAPLGLVSCNQPVGYALYGPPNLPLGNSIQPVCIIEKTLGDRRFGTHVLAGLELLLPFLVDETCIDPKALLSIFPPDRPGQDSGKIENIVATGPFMTDYGLGTLFGGGKNSAAFGLTWPNHPRDQTTLADLTKTQTGLPEKCPRVGVYPKQWTREGPKEMDSKWKTLWDFHAKQLFEILPFVQTSGVSVLTKLKETPTSSVLAYLFSRAGYDAGRILRSFHQSRISWGTYQDGMCRKDLDEWHCNVHANNLVVIPESTFSVGHLASETFLSYLDLDMAFAESSFVDVEKGVMGISPSEFDLLLWREHVSLMETLTGNDCSSGVPAVVRNTREAETSVVIQTVQSGLYDTLILGYLRGYTDEDRFPISPFNEALHRAAHCIIRFALIVMADFIA